MDLPEVRVQLKGTNRGTAKELVVTMLDLSETGCRVLTKPQDGGGIKRNDCFTACFTLPDFDQSFLVPCDVQWKKERKEGTKAMLGLAWKLDWSRQENRQVQDTLARFIVEQQRRFLRRKR